MLILLAAFQGGVCSALYCATSSLLRDMSHEPARGSALMVFLLPIVTVGWRPYTRPTGFGEAMSEMLVASFSF